MNKTLYDVNVVIISAVSNGDGTFMYSTFVRQHELSPNTQHSTQ